MRFSFIVFFVLNTMFVFGQNTIRGKVINEQGESIFAANVYLKSNITKGVTTGFEGEFSLNYDSNIDTLVISYIGYQSSILPLTKGKIDDFLTIILTQDVNVLEEIVIKAQDPISEQFSVKKITKMDIYLNPNSQGDPLKSITLLPASTTTNETANPSLRGSSADRSRVVLNGVPVYKPVKASQLNNQGFFSLFNPEVIKNQYVYASNPPLTHGNTSAGLIEIQTNNKLDKNQLQLSAGLASVGLFNSYHLSDKQDFIQFYGNYQFSNLFIDIQENSFPDIDEFITKDAGVNLHYTLGKKIHFNSFHYYVDESFQGTDELYTFKGKALSENQRYFTINNIQYHSKKFNLSINSGYNTANQKFKFGNIFSDDKVQQLFTSINNQWKIGTKTEIKFGISHDRHINRFKDTLPLYYYAISEVSPSRKVNDTIENKITEAFIYTKWLLNDNITLSMGGRSNIFDNPKSQYYSYQGGIRYEFNKKHSCLLSAGNYHSFATPNFFSRKYNLLSSKQAALDYTFTFENGIFNAAVFYKKEEGEKSENILYAIEATETFGFETYLDIYFFENLKANIAYSFLDQTIKINEKEYNGFNDFNYLIKLGLQYNPDFASFGISYISRPGTYYNSIKSGIYDPTTAFYIPEYADDFYDSQYDNYHRIDCNISKYIPFKKQAVILFLSINNILNFKNQKEPLYSDNYSSVSFKHYQLRTFYFGMVWQLNY